MKTTCVACVAVAALLLAAPTARAQVRQSGDNWSWRGAIAAGKTLEIRGISGSIRAEPASGSAVEVTAEKHGRQATRRVSGSRSWSTGTVSRSAPSTRVTTTSAAPAGAT